MKKILISIFILMFAACAHAVIGDFMDKCMASWVGYHIDSVISSWGYPDDEKTVANRHIFIWEQSELVSTSSTQTTVVNKDKKGKTTVDTFSYGGNLEQMYCKRVLEVDSNNIVTKYQWNGNNCPLFYIAGRKWVNPNNDEWQKKKLQKQAQKAKTL